ncbi:MAG: nitroreductase family protein [Dehalococcoidales bacterium]|nr:nitroreductase family protein [Dehalococcoidales bacterium]
MNETVKTIQNRRSIRQFQERQIGDAELQDIMECAVMAPNAMNQQKWHFSVIQDKDLLRRIAEITIENMLNSGIDFFAARAQDPKFNPFFKAPTVIFVTADEKVRFAQLDAALAAENILIAAESLSVSSLIMTSSDLLFASQEGKALKKEMGIPEGYIHVCTILLGYREGEIPTARPRDKEVITYIR